MKALSRSFLVAVLIVSSALVALAQATVTKSSFGKTAAGENVDLYVLRNVNGMETKITNFGGIVVSLTAPDRNGAFADVVLGFNDLESYLTKNNPYFGALIGRYGNRIGKGRFKLNGVEYKLAVNNGENHLHGGIKGFEWGVIELPANAEGKRSNYASYWVNAITTKAQGEKLEASKKFLAFVTSPEAMEIWLKTVGELPARRSVALTEKNLADPIYGPFLKALDYAQTTLFVDETAQRQISIDMVNRVLLQNQARIAAVSKGRGLEQRVMDLTD